MQTCMEVFQTGRHTTDQVRYHYIVKTLYKIHAVYSLILRLFDAFLINSATLQSSWNLIISSSFFGQYKLFSFLVL